MCGICGYIGNGNPATLEAGACPSSTSRHPGTSRCGVPKGTCWSSTVRFTTFRKSAGSWKDWAMRSPVAVTPRSSCAPGVSGERRACSGSGGCSPSPSGMRERKGFSFGGDFRSPYGGDFWSLLFHPDGRAGGENGVGPFWRKAQKIVSHLVRPSEARVVSSLDRLQRFKKNGGEKDNQTREIERR